MFEAASAGDKKRVTLVVVFLDSFLCRCFILLCRFYGFLYHEIDY